MAKSDLEPVDLIAVLQEVDDEGSSSNWSHSLEQQQQQQRHQLQQQPHRLRPQVQIGPKLRSGLLRVATTYNQG